MRPLALIAGVLAAAAASAQTAPPPDVVVTGKRGVKPGEIVRQAREVSDTADAFDEPLPRFQSPICPIVRGVPVDFERAFLGRLHDDAAAAGVAVGNGGCTPNIAVFFVRNGQAEIEALRRKPTRLFDGLSASDIARLAKDATPVHAWIRTEVRARDGDPQGRDVLRDVRTLMVMSPPSRIDLTTRLDIEAAIVVIDVPAADGMTVPQLADYVAMRSLARTRPQTAAARVDTILSLFSLPRGQRPAEMTTFDLGYLRALYHGAATARGITTLGGVTAAVRAAGREADAKR